MEEAWLWQRSNDIIAIKHWLSDINKRKHDKTFIYGNRIKWKARRTIIPTGSPIADSKAQLKHENNMAGIFFFKPSYWKVWSEITALLNPTTVGCKLLQAKISDKNAWHLEWSVLKLDIKSIRIKMIYWCKHSLLRNFPTNGDSSRDKELLHPDEAGFPDKSLLDANIDRCQKSLVAKFDIWQLAL